jgi:hypothetical protein
VAEELGPVVGQGVRADTVIDIWIRRLPAQDRVAGGRVVDDPPRPGIVTSEPGPAAGHRHRVWCPVHFPASRQVMGAGVVLADHGQDLPSAVHEVELHNLPVVSSQDPALPGPHVPHPDPVRPRVIVGCNDHPAVRADGRGVERGCPTGGQGSDHPAGRQVPHIGDGGHSIAAGRLAEADRGTPVLGHFPDELPGRPVE